MTSLPSPSLNPSLPRLHASLAIPFPRFGNRYLMDFLASSSDPRLVSEIIRTVQDILRVPSNPDVPVTQQQREMNLLILPCNPSRGLKRFMTNLITRSNVGNLFLAYVLLILDRLKPKISIFTAGPFRHQLSLILTTFVVASTHIMAVPLTYKSWTKYTDGVFITSQMVSMERHMVELLGPDICFTEVELSIRLGPLMYSKRDKALQGAVKGQHGNTARALSNTTPKTSSLRRRGPSSAPKTTLFSWPKHFDWLEWVKKLIRNPSSARHTANGGQGGRKESSATFLSIILSLKQTPPSSAIRHDFLSR